MRNRIKIALPQPGYFSRMHTYLACMHPVPHHILFSALLYLSLAFLMRRASDVGSPIFSPYAGIGIGGFFCVMLLTRLMDEIKDKEIDSKLFPSRPLPSGKVVESDINFSITLVVAIYLIANLWAGPALWVALLVIGYSLLMFVHFFIPHILKKSILLTLATQNPLIALVLLHVLTLFSVENGVPLKALNWRTAFLLIVMYWSMFLAWEIARKIRSQEEENAYVTYSQVFGAKGAVLIAWGAQSLTLVIALYFHSSLSFSAIFVALLAAGYLSALWGHARFLLKPTAANSHLGDFAQRFIISVLVAPLVEHELGAGSLWSKLLNM
jgi:UbiA prenyltransferase family